MKLHLHAGARVVLVGSCTQAERSALEATAYVLEDFEAKKGDVATFVPFDAAFVASLPQDVEPVEALRDIASLVDNGGPLWVSQRGFGTTAVAWFAREREGGLPKPELLRTFARMCLRELLETAGLFVVESALSEDVPIFVATSGDVPLIPSWSEDETSETERRVDAALALAGVAREDEDSLLRMIDSLLDSQRRLHEELRGLTLVLERREATIAELRRRLALGGGFVAIATARTNTIR